MDLFGINHNENTFLNWIATGDATWVHYAEPETKAQSKHLISSPPKRFKLSPSACKVMLVTFWDVPEIILAHFMPKCQTVTSRYYSEVIKKIKVASEASPENVLLHESPLSYCLIYSRTHQLLQVAIIVPPYL